MVRVFPQSFLMTLAYGLTVATLVMGAEPTAVRSAALTSIEVQPEQIALRGAGAHAHVLVTGRFDDGSQADLTRRAKYVSLAPEVVSVSSQGRVTARSDGAFRVRVVVSLADAQGKPPREFSAEIAGEATDVATTLPADFHTDVIAGLSKAGCNQGACHGSPQGKNGFRLSLRGFDPTLDFMTLAKEDFGRRANPLEPESSLVLKKGAAIVPHQGGKRFDPSEPAYRVVKQWIAEGCRPTAKPVALKRLEVWPLSGRLHERHPQQQVLARAHFDDGSSRDVTDLAVFTVNKEDAATISNQGLVDFTKTGEASILVRYLGAVVSTRLTYVKRDPSYVFRGPPEVNEIDRLMFAKQRSLQLQPAAVASDAVFLRRVYFDTIGLPPTAEEAAKFLDSRAPNKRADLIESLIARPEFAEMWALRWADVMRGSDVTISKRGVHSFHRYLVSHFRDDRPFDRFARETLTSQGNTLHVPAANFHRIARTPDEAAEAMSQLFLGVRIGCAKCHNHPFEAITQDDYYGFAAYFARVKFKGKQFMVDDEIVYIDRQGEVRHPTKNTTIPPAAFGVAAGNLAPTDDRRVRLADWLVSPENRYFAPSIVNRVWYHLLGRGLVDPVDDFRDTNPAADPELLAQLARGFIDDGYRLKPLVRKILNSNTYQLSSSPVKQSPQAATPDAYFTHVVPRMLTAEQVLDAISSVTGLPEKFPGYPLGTRAASLADGAVEHPFLKAFSKPVRDVTCECAREDDPSLGQVIHLLNNPGIVANVKSPRGRIEKWLDDGKSDAEIVETMYLTTLSRRATKPERELIDKHLQAVVDRKEAFCDLQHALFNTNEFLLRH